MSHYHWIIYAAEIKTEHGFAESTSLDVVATNLDEALEKAKRLIPSRHYYWCASVVEHHDHQAAPEAGA